ncbi:MAG: hypothetical protein H6641_07550 [Caldilineaceae bacterium]|nr:hypothetical protein [Caldilineaceae bacterium]
MTSYEGAANTFNTTGLIHAVKNSSYTYDANGNLKTRPVQLTTGNFAIPGQTLTWDVENRLVTVSGTSINNTAITESYLYDEAATCRQHPHQKDQQRR